MLQINCWEHPKVTVYIMHVIKFVWLSWSKTLSFMITYVATKHFRHPRPPPVTGMYAFICSLEPVHVCSGCGTNWSLSLHLMHCKVKQNTPAPAPSIAFQLWARAGNTGRLCSGHSLLACSTAKVGRVRYGPETWASFVPCVVVRPIHQSASMPLEPLLCTYYTACMYVCMQIFYVGMYVTLAVLWCSCFFLSFIVGGRPVYALLLLLMAPYLFHI